MDDAALGEAVDASFVDAFRRLANRESGFTARFGSVQVAAMGFPGAFFNPIFVLEALSAPDDLAAALAALRSRELPFVVHIRGNLDEGSVSVARELGLKQTAVLPGMALAVPATARAAPPQGLRFQRVLDKPAFSAALAVAAEGFGMPLPFAEMAFPQSMLDDAMRGYVAYAIDDPVATATSIQLGSVLGIYNVATVPARRRSGYGTAVTWHAIDEADPGTTAVVLQSSPDGVPVYERMGFRTVVEYLEFEPA
jgi:GNAT superfamily N-acetyltransferase